MKKRILATILSVVMIAGICTVASAADTSYDASAGAPEESVVLSDANLLYAAGGDVSIENSTLGEWANGFSNWTVNGSGIASDDVAHYGSKCVEFAADWKGATGSFTVDMKKDTYYKFSFWYFCQPGGANSVMTVKDQSGKVIKDVDGMGAPEGDEIWFSASKDGVWDANNCGEWKYVERTILASDDITRLDLIINGYQVSYYDDFCVLEIGASLPTPEPVVATPTPIVTPTPDNSNPIPTYKTGYTVSFGNYWQNDTNGDGKADENDEKEPIKWRVLSQSSDDIFLIATKGLDAQPYNKIVTETGVTWETCTLRTWLNDEFYNNAFNADERNAIKTTTLENNTTDKVFLLSLNDITNIGYGFLSKNTSDTNRQMKVTKYAEDRNTNNAVSDSRNGNGLWWLRSLGNTANYAAFVHSDGFISYQGCYVNDDSKLVCPVLHLNPKLVDLTPEPTASASPTSPTIQHSSLVLITGDFQHKIKDDGTSEIMKYLGDSKVLQIPTTLNGYKVTSIGDNAFANNDTLQNVFMPEHLEIIGKHAFDSCLSLVNVGFNEKLKTVEAYAFYNCPALTTVIIPETITNIGKNAFGYDKSNNVIYGFVITGFAGTAAEKYATANDVSFNNLGEGKKPVKKTIKFIKKSVKIKRGKKVTLKVKITGAKKATFSVDKKGKKVVKLSKKKAKSVVVKGKKKGKATITAKAAGKKAICKVTVK